MDLENLLFCFLLIGCLVIVLVQMDNDKEKEIEIIKKTKEYTIYQNCEYLDEEWYCYD